MLGHATLPIRYGVLHGIPDLEWWYCLGFVKSTEARYADIFHRINI